jgi:hypothetical protein
LTEKVLIHTHPPGMGSIRIGGIGTFYDNNSVVLQELTQYQIEAVPPTGYVFSYWSTSMMSIADANSQITQIVTNGGANIQGDLGANFVPAPACQEGTYEIISYCPAPYQDHVYQDRTCVNGQWVVTTHQCPVCTEGDIQPIDYCWDGSIHTYKKCVNGQWMTLTNTCPTNPNTDRVTKGVHLTRFIPTDRVTKGINLVRYQSKELWTKGIHLVRFVPTDRKTLGIHAIRALVGEKVTLGINLTRGPSGPPPSVTCTPPSGLDAFDLTKWQAYFTCLINNGITDLKNTISAEFSALGSSFSNIWPDWLKSGFSDALAAVKSIVSFLTDPSAFVSAVVKSLIKESSPSLLGDIQKAYSQIGIDVLPNYTDPRKTSVMGVITALYEGIIGTYLGQLTTLISDPNLTPEQLQAQMQKLIITASADAESWGVLFEAIPWIDLSIAGDIVKASLDYLGTDAVKTDYIDKLLKASVSRKWEQAANTRFPLALPDPGTLTTLKHRSMITDAEYYALIAKAQGINQDFASKSSQASLQVPGIDDFIMWNARHPNASISLSKIAELVGLDYSHLSSIGVNLADIFNERQYDDIPLRSVRSIYASGVLSEGDLDNIISRHRLRKDLLPGQSMSDFDIMKAYAKQAKDAAAAKATAKAEKTKMFTPPELATYWADGVADEFFVDGEIDKMNYDQQHKAILKSWVKFQRDAKVAKAQAKASTTS